jgi:beta-lactamase class A
LKGSDPGTDRLPDLPHRAVNTLETFDLDFDTPTDPGLQSQLERLDPALRARWDMSPEQSAVGLLDLTTLRLAMLHPDREEYAASLAKIGILLAYFAINPGAVLHLSTPTRRELSLMIKTSSNEIATRFSRELGLIRIQQVLNTHGFYHPLRGGGLWMGKHYGQNSERFGDPVGDNSHAATVRQVLRFYLLLEQGRLISPSASSIMREIFAEPGIPHDNIKFVRALQGRGVALRRKWGSWEDWNHDSAVVTGPGRHYILVGLTRHACGDQYLEELARRVDQLLAPNP